MFGTLGGPELFLIFVVALIIFGPRKLPDIGKSLGKMMAEFRRASNEFKSTIESEVEAEKIRDSMRIETPPAPPAYPVESTATSPGATSPEASAASSEAAAAGAEPPPGEATPSEPAPREAAPSEAAGGEAEATPAPPPAESPADPAPDAGREPVPETVSRQPEPQPTERK